MKFFKALFRPDVEKVMQAELHSAKLELLANQSAHEYYRSMEAMLIERIDRLEQMISEEQQQYRIGTVPTLSPVRPQT